MFKKENNWESSKRESRGELRPTSLSEPGRPLCYLRVTCFPHIEFEQPLRKIAYQFCLIQGYCGTYLGAQPLHMALPAWDASSKTKEGLRSLRVQSQPKMLTVTAELLSDIAHILDIFIRVLVKPLCEGPIKQCVTGEAL